MAPRLELKVIPEDPSKASVPTLFSNYVGLARAGTEVQFEFVALDINVLATKMTAHGVAESTSPVEVTGKTVAKIVVPLHVFMQLERHLEGIFAAVKQEFAFNEDEVGSHERRAIS